MSSFSFIPINSKGHHSEWIDAIKGGSAVLSKMYL